MSLHTTLITVDELAALPAQDVLIVDCRFELAAPGRDSTKGEQDYRALLKNEWVTRHAG